MTVNIEALIRSLDKPYQAIRDAGIITYKTPPQGTQSDLFLSLDMKKEGVFLSFDNDSQKTLREISLRLKSGRQNGVYPNELPAPLKLDMPRWWVHETFGEPDKSIQPEVAFKRRFGWRDRFTIEDFHIPITMVILFGADEIAESVTFLPTSRLRW
jgi:hypothetical protein